jgi:hypothetical protein
LFVFAFILFLNTFSSSHPAPLIGAFNQLFLNSFLRRDLFRLAWCSILDHQTPDILPLLLRPTEPTKFFITMRTSTLLWPVLLAQTGTAITVDPTSSGK